MWIFHRNKEHYQVLVQKNELQGVILLMMIAISWCRINIADEYECGWCMGCWCSRKRSPCVGSTRNQGTVTIFFPPQPRILLIQIIAYHLRITALVLRVLFRHLIVPGLVAAAAAMSLRRVFTVVLLTLFCGVSWETNSPPALRPGRTKWACKQQSQPVPAMISTAQTPNSRSLKTWKRF